MFRLGLSQCVTRPRATAGADDCAAQAWQSPLVVDLGNQGITMTSPQDGVAFDILGNGRRQQIGWLAAGEKVLAIDRNGDGMIDATEHYGTAAFLAFDRNGNGTIDNVDELFGNNTLDRDGTSHASTNGFEALGQYDGVRPPEGGSKDVGLWVLDTAARDHYIDRDDAIYERLSLWFDENHNGVSEPDELVPLARSGVAKIDVEFTPQLEVDDFGNVTLQRSYVMTEQGVRRIIFDLWFAPSSQVPKYKRANGGRISVPTTEEYGVLDDAFFIAKFALGQPFP